MSKAATVVLSWTVTGDEASGGTSQVVSTVAPTSAQLIVAPLANGRNQVTLPAGFKKVVLLPPGSLPGETPSTITKTWDSASATGGALDPAGPSYLSVPSGTINIYIGANGSENLRIYAF